MFREAMGAKTKLHAEESHEKNFPSCQRRDKQQYSAGRQISANEERKIITEAGHIYLTRKNLGGSRDLDVADPSATFTLAPFFSGLCPELVSHFSPSNA